MKITIHGDGRESIVTDVGVTADDVLQECLDCMLGMGFAAVSVKEAILGKAEEYEDN